MQLQVLKVLFMSGGLGFWTIVTSALAEGIKASEVQDIWLQILQTLVQSNA